jgi:hypothetical protein
MNFENILKHESNNLSKFVDELLNENKNYEISILNGTTMEIYGKNKKILTVKYEILGSFDISLMVFSWAYKLMIIDKKTTKLSRKIKKHKKKIKKLIVNKNFNDSDFLEEIYYYLSNGIFFVDKDKINNIIILSLFITKCKGIINITKNNTILYFLITDIISY